MDTHHENVCIWTHFKYLHANNCKNILNFFNELKHTLHWTCVANKFLLKLPFDIQCYILQFFLIVFEIFANAGIYIGCNSKILIISPFV